MELGAWVTSGGSSVKSDIGVLTLVGTPIGNLGDLSPRAVESLRDADIILCEDTRHTKKLLSHNDIHGPKLLSLHEHNELARVREVIALLGEGKSLVLVSDAGMPAISDPGQRLVDAVMEVGCRVTVVPGASAVLAAVAVSGLVSDRFCFEGFLPVKGSQRNLRLTDFSHETRTVVILEAPHRLAKTVADLIKHCGETRRIVLARELTKLHEEVWRGTLAELSQRLVDQDVKGECVLVLEGAEVKKPLVSDEEIMEA